MRSMAKVLAASLLLLALGNADAAPITYTFTFTDFGTAGQIDGTGSFVTGDASTVDPGYFLLSSITFTSVRTNAGLQTGSAVATSFESGAAYDPANQRFINHYLDGTYSDFGGAFARGTLGPYNQLSISSDDFAQAGGTRFAGRLFGSNGNPLSFSYAATLAIVGPQVAAVPEPGSLALIAFGLVGMGLRLRRHTVVG